MRATLHAMESSPLQRRAGYNNLVTADGCLPSRLTTAIRFPHGDLFHLSQNDNTYTRARFSELNAATPQRLRRCQSSRVTRARRLLVGILHELISRSHLPSAQRTLTEACKELQTAAH